MPQNQNVTIQQISQISQSINKARGVLNDIEQNIQDADEFLEKVPLLGQLDLSDLTIASVNSDAISPGTLNFVGEISDALDIVSQQVSGLTANATVEQVKDIFLEELGVGGLKLVQNRNDIKISVTDDELRLDLDLASDLPLFGQAIATDLGIPGLKIKIEENSKAQLDLDYKFKFAFGFNQSGFFFDTPEDEDIEIDLKASLPNLDINGELGFLELDVTDSAETPSSFKVELDIDLDTKNGNSSVKIDPTGNLDLNLDLTADLEDNGKDRFPSISTEFSWVWSDLFNRNISDSEIAFNNVQLELGSFFSGFAQPVIGAIDKVIKPFKPIRDVLTTNIPGLDDLGLEINLLQLANNPLIGEVDSSLFDAIDDFVNVVDTVNSAQEIFENLSESDSFISLGSFTANSEGGIKNKNPNRDPLQHANNKVSNFFADVERTSGGLRFPLVKEPTTAFNLLLGENVELLKFQLPGFEARLEGGQTFPIPTPLPILVNVSYGYNAKFTSDGLTFGYDTSGFENNDPFQGLFIDGSKPVFEIDADIFGKIFAGVERIAAAGGEAFINGEVDFYLPGKDKKTRISALFNDFNDNFFDAEGSVKAGANLWAEHITFNPVKAISGILTGDAEKLVDRYEKNLVTFDIFDFGTSNSSGASTPPPPPNLATLLGNGDLRLNMGRFANERNIEPTVLDESFSVTGNVTVSAFGEQEAYTNVSKIIAFADAGDDVISIGADVEVSAELGDGVAIEPDVDIVAELHGGLGSDTLYGGSQNDLLFGDEDADRLIGRKGNDQIYGGIDNDSLYGSEGNDSLYGGTGNDLLDGDQDNDLLYGGAGNDTLIGGIGNDSLKGEANDDSLFGGDGNDTLQGGADNDLLAGGSGEDLLDGGIGNDRLFGETGNDELIGAIGDDLLDGGEGDDTLQGGDGHDRLFGGVRVITEPVFEKTDLEILDENGLPKFPDVQVFDENGQPVFTEPQILDDPGRDVLDGGKGHDSLEGAAGDDFLRGGADDDLIDGGNDIDTVSYDTSPNGVVVNIDEANDYQNAGGIFHTTRVSTTLIPTDAEPGFAIASGTALDGFGDIDTLRNLENIIGSENNDVLIGNDQDNDIQGLGGNDLLIGNAGDDTLNGGAGNDTVSYRRDPGPVIVNLEQAQAQDGFGDIDQIFGTENVVGSAFNDDVTGDANNNIIAAGSGEDTVSGGKGDDILFGEDGNDTLNGDEGDDFLVGGSGNGWPSDILNGGDGNDTASYFNASSGVAASLLQKNGWLGDAAGDQLNSIENLEGSDFNDFLVGDNDANTLIGLQGDDNLDGGFGDDTLIGDEGRDTLWGNDGHDSLEGGLDNDILRGGMGNDILDGGAGDDALDGGLDDDILSGGDGNNRLDAGEGDNIIDAEDGNNRIVAGPGNDIVTVGNGDNDIRVGEGSNSVTVGDGNNVIYGGAKVDIIDAGDGNNQIFAAEGDNQITTGNGDNLISGGAGNDWIMTGAGDDIIRAAGGNNYIDAGAGNNIIYSGSDRDQFVLQSGMGSTTINQFDIGKDVLVLSGLTFEQLSITQGQSNHQFFTEISVADSNDLLATLNWVQADAVTPSSFQFV